MLEQPAETGGIACRIAGSSDGVEGEANAEKPPDGPVRDAVAEKVEEDPGCDHGDDGCGLRMGGSGESEGNTSSYDTRKLHRISGDD